MAEENKYKIRTKRKKDTGRPTVMTPETINKLEQAFSLGCSDKRLAYMLTYLHKLYMIINIYIQSLLSEKHY